MLTFLKKLFKPSADFTKLVKEGAVIVDVRTKSEYRQVILMAQKIFLLILLKRRPQV